jgi:hypothetical protein
MESEGTPRTLISTGLSSKSVLRFATKRAWLSVTCWMKKQAFKRTLCQLSKLDGCIADVFANCAGHAGKLAFTVSASLFVKKTLLVGISCR